MRKIFLGVALLALGASAWAADSGVDSRSAKIMDESGAESQVSGLMVTNVDLRFGLDRPDDRDRIVVTTANIEVAIPLRAVTSITQLGGTTWTVKYQAKGGEATISGSLPPATALAGDSDFGSFVVPLGRLKRLEFLQAGTAAQKPARRVSVYDQNGSPRSGSFNAVLNFTDGTQLQAGQLRRNQVSAQVVSDPLVLARPSYALLCTNYTDFRLLRGATLQTIPFEKVNAAEFLPGEQVGVRVKSGAEATMQVPQRADEVLEGFNGTSSKGDFYVPLKFVRSVTFKN